MSGALGPRERFDAAIVAIDAANADDPISIEVRGARRPKELAHAELMTEWVRRLDPHADEVQLLAARAHHLRRWSLPRSSYPAGRAGYLRWRTALRKQHGAEVAAILEAVGYEPEVVERVQAIVEKRGLGSDPAVQVHEDALCLVFLETQLADTVDRLGEGKVVDVVRKTAAKMSPAGLARVADLPLRPQDRALIEQALAP
ncbi:MAG: DUF4202 domain-containing protein [Acidimicrobiia bacterium]